ADRGHVGVDHGGRPTWPPRERQPVGRLQFQQVLERRVERLGHGSPQPWWMRVPSRSRNFASQRGWAGHAGAVTRLPSAWAWSTATSTHRPPAPRTSGATDGYAVQPFPRTTPAAFSTWTPWRTAAIGLPASAKWRTPAP